MVFQKKGGAATKRNFQQVNEKAPKKKVFQEEEDDDDDDDIDMEDDSDLDDIDSDDANGSGDARGKLSAKGKPTPNQGKGSPFVKTPGRQLQSPALLLAKKNQPTPPLQKQGKQNKMDLTPNQSKGSPFIKTPQRQLMVGSGKKKVLDSEAVEVDSDDDDDEDDDDDDEDDGDDAVGKLNAKGKQAPAQGKDSSLVKTPKGQMQSAAVSSGKKNQLAAKQTKQNTGKDFPGTKGFAGKGMIAGKEVAKDDDSDDDEDDDDDDDDDDDSDSDDTGGKLTAKGKQTPTQGKGSWLIKGPKGQAGTQAVSSGKKNQLATPLQNQSKQNPMKEFPGIKGSAGKGNIMGKQVAVGDDDDDSDDVDDDDDDDDDSDDDDEADKKTAGALNKSAGKKTPNDKKDMHVSFELPKKGGAAGKVQKSQQNIPALAKKNQQAAVTAPGVQQGKSAKQNALKKAPGKEATKGKKNAEPDEDDDDDLSEGDDEEEDDDDDDDDMDEEDDDMDSDDEEEAIKKKVASLKKEMLPGKKEKSVTESNTKSQELKNKKANDQKGKSQQAPDSKGALKADKPVQNKAVQESLQMELQRKRERDARTLFVRGLPNDATVDEIKALSPDIIDVRFPKGLKFHKRTGPMYGFLEFANEKKAEENYEKLKKKKFRGQEIFIDFSGEKSKNKAVADSTSSTKNICNKKLYIDGLPTDVTMAEVAQLFPRCYNITLNNAPNHRNCNASFNTAEDAAEAFKANQNAKIRGQPVSVLYYVETKQNRRGNFGKRPFEGNRFSGKPFGNKQFSPNKRQKRDNM